MAGSQDLRELEKDPRLFLYTSLTAGSSHIITATSRLETILKANKVPFLAIDVATDEKARKLWQRRAGGKKLPGLVKEGYVLGDLEEIEEWNEYGELKENIGSVPASGAAIPVPKLPVNTTATGGSASITPKPTFDSSKMVALPGAAEIKARNNPVPISSPEDAVKPEKMTSSAVEKGKSIQTSIRFKGDVERQASGTAGAEEGAVKGNEQGTDKTSSAAVEKEVASSTARETTAEPSQPLDESSKAESGATEARPSSTADATQTTGSAATQTSTDAAETSKAEPSAVDTSKAESSAVDTSKAEPSNVKTSKAEPSAVDTSKAETSKAEPSNVETSKAEAQQTADSADATQTTTSASTDAADPEASTDAVESQSTTQLKASSTNDDAVGETSASKAVPSTKESSKEDHGASKDIAPPVETQTQAAADPEDASKSVED